MGNVVSQLSVTYFSCRPREIGHLLQPERGWYTQSCESVAVCFFPDSYGLWFCCVWAYAIGTLRGGFIITMHCFVVDAPAAAARIVVGKKRKKRLWRWSMSGECLTSAVISANLVVRRNRAAIRTPLMDGVEFDPPFVPNLVRWFFGN